MKDAIVYKAFCLGSFFNSAAERVTVKEPQKTWRLPHYSIASGK